MATTTSSTSTTTTTTETPPSQPRRRPQRPYHRPYGRRPVDGYYDEEDFIYEDEDEDVYYENRGHRHKSKARPRPRKPQSPVYDDEFDDEERRIEVKPTRRNRNQYRDEDDDSDVYDEEQNRPNRPGGRRGKPTSSGSGAGGRAKASPRKPGRGVDERRSFNEERDRDIDREELRRSKGNGRRRNNEKRTTPSAEDVLDEYEKPYELDQEEAAEEQTPLKVKTTSKPLTEFVTPKAAPASVYSRPRAPPRIARPVPINEKKKYSYPVQKKTATTPAEDEDYYQEPVEETEQEQEQEDYEEQPVRSTPRRRTASPREQKPTRSTLRKSVPDKKTLLEDQDYYAPDTRRKRPQGAGRTRAPPAAEPYFVDDVDYEEKTTPARTQRVRPAARKPVQRPRQPIERVPSIEKDDEEQEEEHVEEEQPGVPPARSRVNALRRNLHSKLPQLSSKQRALPTSGQQLRPPWRRRRSRRSHWTQIRMTRRQLRMRWRQPSHNEMLRYVW